MKKIITLAIASICAFNAPALAQDHYVTAPGDDNFTQVCKDRNWEKVGFNSYEECVEVWGEPEPEGLPKPDRGGNAPGF